MRIFKCVESKELYIHYKTNYEYITHQNHTMPISWHTVNPTKELLHFYIMGQLTGGGDMQASEFSPSANMLTSSFII
jgi:hypothetical protein